MSLSGHLRIDVVQRYLAGSLPEEARRATLAHIESCEECRALLLAASSLMTRAPPRPARSGTLPVVPEEHYVIEREIGRGGLGKILSARHLPLDRVVAVKELISAEPEHQSRFVHEALITASLQHPGIVPVHEAGRWPSGEPFYAMKLVAGQTLRNVLEETVGLDARLALLPRLIAVGEALAYAHARGVIHRDVKPANILLGEFGETVLIDWGLAKRIEETSASGTLTPMPSDSVEETAAGIIVGTPRYMSPEQASGGVLDARTDVYALGVVLYELLTGSSPYADRGEGALDVGVEELRTRISSGRIVPVRMREPEAPADLVTIVERALALENEKRYPSAKALVEDLERFTTGQLISRRYTSGELARRWLERHARLVAVGAAALALLIAVAVVSAVRVAGVRHDARVAAARLELDEGRRLLQGGEPLMALAYLDAALHDGADGPGARYLVARAAAAVSSQRLVVELPATAVAFRPDGRELAVGGDRGAAIVDAASGAERRLLAEPGVSVVEWSPEGKLLLVGGTDGSLRVWDLAAETVVITIDAVRGRVVEADADPAWTRFLAVGEDGAVRVFSAQTGAPVCATEPAPAGLRSASFSPDGARFVVTGGAESVYIHSSRDCARLVGLAGVARFPRLVRFDPPGGRIFVAGAESAGFWNATTGAPMQALPPASVAAFSRDGERLATAHGAQILVWNARDGRFLARLAGHGGDVRGLAWSPDGRRLASAGFDGTVRLWTAPRPAPARSSADGALVAARQTDGTARVTEAATQLLLETLPLGSYDEAAELPRDRRPLADLDRFVDACVPHRVEDGRLVDRAVDPARCAAVLRDNDGAAVPTLR